MFDPDSRYASLATATHTTPDGRPITYVTRRFLPAGDTMATLVEITVARGDRLDLIASRAFGDPLRFYQICDANEAMHPDELVDEPGRRVRIALPGT
jgi:hypothetical protein